MASTGNVINRYYQEILHFCQRKVKNPEAAADLVQDSFVRLLTMERAGQAIIDTRALLRKVAVHLKIDMDRRAAIRQHEDLDNLREIEIPAAPAHEQPEEACAAMQSAQAYLEAIAGLPTRCREAFELYAFEELPNKEIAERMGISLSMVNQYISRGKLACAACRAALEAPPPGR